MRKQIIGLFLLLNGALFLSSCDEGRIYQDRLIVSEEGRSVKFTGEMQGMDTWPSGYSIVIAGFTSESEYAETAMSVTAAGSDGISRVTMSGIPDNVTKLELCVINRIRERVVTFVERDITEAVEDTIYMDVVPQDVSMYNAIQTNIFEEEGCTQCHNATESASARLHLTAGLSYDQLVNHPATIDPTKNRVTPGNVEESVLHTELNKDEYVHQAVSLADKKVLRDLIDNWIKDGAKR